MKKLHHGDVLPPLIVDETMSDYAPLTYNASENCYYHNGNEIYSGTYIEIENSDEFGYLKYETEKHYTEQGCYCDYYWIIDLDGKSEIEANDIDGLSVRYQTADFNTLMEKLDAKYNVCDAHEQSEECDESLDYFLSTLCFGTLESVEYESIAEQCMYTTEYEQYWYWH